MVTLRCSLALLLVCIAFLVGVDARALGLAGRSGAHTHSAKPSTSASEVLTRELEIVLNDALSDGARRVEVPFLETVKCSAPFTGQGTASCLDSGDSQRCFDVQRCANKPFRVFVYPSLKGHPDAMGSDYPVCIQHPQNGRAIQNACETSDIMTALRSDPMLKHWTTSDPAEACLFYPSVDVSATVNSNVTQRCQLLHQVMGRYTGSSTPGVNHIITFLSDYRHPPCSVPGALRWVSNAFTGHTALFQPNVDVSIPLSPWKNPRFWKTEQGAQARRRAPDQRPVVASFKGEAFPESVDEHHLNTHRRDLLRLHNGRDWVIVEYCQPYTNQTHLYPNRTCAEIKKAADEVRYNQLIHDSRFCLVPEGWGYHSYRLTECLFWGSIPVIISDLFLPPLTGLLDWNTFSVHVPKADISNLPAILNGLDQKHVHQLWQNAVYAFENYMLNESVWVRKVLSLMERRIHCKELTAMAAKRRKAKVIRRKQRRG